MAFAGIFLNQFKRVTYATPLPTAFTAHPQQQRPTSYAFNDDKDDNSNSQSRESEFSINNNQDYAPAKFPGILNSDLTSLNTNQRNIFIGILAILFVLSLCGNIATLFVNFRRKIRPFFRACLISLAFSDLINTVFLTTAYASQFTAKYVQIWRLGDLMCSLVPFATTTAILASSMTLVGIAVDRYFAVMKAVMGFWNPSLISCIVCVFCIWLASIGIACPVFTIYNIISVYILMEGQEIAGTATVTTSDIVIMISKKSSVINATMKPPAAAAASSSWQEHSLSLLVEDLSTTLVREQQLVNMCVSKQKNVTLYYATVFVIIFLPCLGAFFWFNSIIARKLWQRRHVAAIYKRKTFKIKNKTQRQTSFPKAEIPTANVANGICNHKLAHISNTTVPNSFSTILGGIVTKSPTTATLPFSSSLNNYSNAATNSSREARHLRMFTIILLMMAVFVFLRLPAWIFLLMRIYGNYTKPIDWILYFTFGLMNLASSVLNPLFYTFLTETIQYTLKFKAKLKALVCSCYDHVCCCVRNNNKAATATCLSHHTEQGQMPQKLKDLKIHNNSWRFIRNTFCCQQTDLKSSQCHQSDWEKNEIQSKNSAEATSNNKDEGVDCNDEIDVVDVRNLYEYNQRIFTIFSPSLVSSSVNSQNF